jgi:hypothetical protein
MRIGRGTRKPGPLWWDSTEYEVLKASSNKLRIIPLSDTVVMFIKVTE